jgi:hypothetical protein
MGAEGLLGRFLHGGMDELTDRTDGGLFTAEDEEFYVNENLGAT